MNITKLVAAINPRSYSASVAELGYNAGTITWCRAVADASNLLPEISRQSKEHFIINSSDWTAEEIADYTDAMVDALILQWIAGDMRECDMPSNPDDAWWKEYEEGCNAGRYAGRIYRGDDNQIYFDLEA